MTQQRNLGNGASLPPIQNLLGRLYECRFPGCQHLSPDLDRALQHEQNCDASRNDTMSFGRFHPGQLPVQPHRIQTHFAQSRASSVSSDGTDSGRSTAMFTPNVSRAPSVSAPSGRRTSSTTMPIRTRSHAHSRNPSSPLGNSDGAREKQDKKTLKEKNARKEHGAVLRREEDFMRNYLGWECIEQSGGNGNGAGIQANKIRLMRAFESAGYAALHQLFCNALANGRVEQFQAEFRAMIEDSTAGPSEEQQPFAGTFMFRDHDKPCDHVDSKSKACSTHDHPDWRECRRLHTDATFQENARRYVRQLQAGRRY